MERECEIEKESERVCEKERKKERETKGDLIERVSE